MFLQVADILVKLFAVYQANQSAILASSQSAEIHDAARGRAKTKNWLREMIKHRRIVFVDFGLEVLVTVFPGESGF